MQIYIDLEGEPLIFESSQDVRIPSIGEDIVYDNIRYNVMHITTYYNKKGSYTVYIGTKLIDKKVI